MGKKRVLILNPGTHPEPMHFAAGLVGKFDVVYVTSSSWPSSGVLMSAMSLPLVRNLRIAGELRRRALPEAIPGAAVRAFGRSREAVAMITSRLVGPRRAARAIQRRNDAFERGASRMLRGSSEFEFVVAQYTAAERAFRSPGLHRRILLYPIAHHAWMAEHLGEEGFANPEWASFLQGHDIDEERLRQLDEEVRLADLIVVPSSFAAATFIERGIRRDKVMVLSLGTDLSEVVVSEEEAAAELENSNLPIRLIFAGQVNQRKGIGYLLDAIDVLGPDLCTLAVVGPCEPEMRQLLKTSYPHVRVYPPAARDELKRLMADSDLLVLPSLAEGFGLVGIEAMGVGTPAIVSESTFATDVITDGVDGWVVPTASTKDLVRVISSVAHDRELLIEVSIAARRRARDFSWAAYSQEAADLISHVAAGPR